MITKAIQLIRSVPSAIIRYGVLFPLRLASLSAATIAFFASLPVAVGLESNRMVVCHIIQHIHCIRTLMTVLSIGNIGQIVLQSHFVLVGNHTKIYRREALAVRTARLCCKSYSTSTIRSYWKTTCLVGKPHLLPWLHCRQCPSIPPCRRHGTPPRSTWLLTEQWAELFALHDLRSSQSVRAKESCWKVNQRKDKERRQRLKVESSLRKHVSNPITWPNPMLIFPEGTCVNNKYTIRFQKGAFELGVKVCPIGIK